MNRVNATMKTKSVDKSKLKDFLTKRKIPDKKLSDSKMLTAFPWANNEPFGSVVSRNGLARRGKPGMKSREPV